MSEDNVTKLDGAGFTVITSGTNEGSLLHAIESFLLKREILDDLENLDESVELEAARSDESKLGPLTQFERRCFVLGTVLQEIIKDELVNIETASADEITKLARARKMPMVQAAMEYASAHRITIEKDVQITLNACAVTSANVLTSYEWSVRQRYGCWLTPLIVRNGFVVYTYG